MIFRGGDSGTHHRILRREWFAIVALLLLAFALRTVSLTSVPPGLHNDEVVEIKITESVADGRVAIFFPEDTGHEALYYYFAAPFVRVFGSAVFAMRLPAVFMSMISMCVIWALARRLLGPIAALTALAGFAITFWPLAFGRIVLRVVMEAPLAALAAYCFWRARLTDVEKSGFSVSKATKTWFLYALSGLWLGLSLNVHTAARILPAIFVVFGVYTLFVDRLEWHRWWGGIAITLTVAAIVTLPLFLYFVQNPTADQLAFFDIDRPLVELRRGNLAPVIETSLKTLGMFAFVGDPLPYYDVPGRPIFEPVGALLLGVGLLIALWRWRQPEYAFVLLWFFLSLAPGMLSQPAPNYTRTLGVQVVLFAIPGIAITALLDRWRNVIVYSALALLFVGNLAWTARDYFYVWPKLDVVQFWHQSGLKAVADRLQDDADTSPVAICLPDHLIDERELWWKPGWQHTRYLLHRPDLSLRYYNCADAMLFMDGPARYAFPDVADVDALDQFPIYVQILAATNPDLDFLSDRLGIIVHSDAALELDEEDHLAQAPVNFQDMVEFLGYASSASPIKPGDSLHLTTYWRVTDALPPQLSQFTHLLNVDGAIVTQQDRLALTSARLRAGDVFAQQHRLTLPGDLAAGEYALTIGLYTLPDGARLQITQADHLRGDRLWLKPVVVVD